MKKYILPIISTIFLIISIIINIKPEEYNKQETKTESIKNYTESAKEEIKENIKEEPPKGESVFLVEQSQNIEETKKEATEEILIPENIESEEEKQQDIVIEENIQNEEYKDVESEVTETINSTEETEEKEIVSLNGIYKIKSNTKNLNISDNDNWIITYNKDKNTYYIKSLNNNNNYLTSSSLKVELNGENTDLNKDWTIEKEDNYYLIKSKDNNKCLSLSEDYIKVKKCNNELEEQKLEIISQNISNLENKKYKIKTYLKNEELSLSDDKVILTESNSTKENIWYLNNINNLEYEILNSTNTSIILNNDLSLSKEHNNWNIVLNSDNTYIISKDNLCLNNDLILEECNNNDNQKFIFEEYNDKLFYKGIDISSYQENIDWEKLKNSEVEFVIIRAGYGDNWTSQDDKKLIDNVSNCEKYNIPYGIYLYSYATKLEGPSDINIDSESVSSEIAHILRILDNLNTLGYSPNIKTKVFYDIEDDNTIYLGKEKLTNMADTFCTKIEESGYKCGIYANKYFYTTNLDYNYLSSKYGIWYAYWNNLNTYEDALSNINSDLNYNIWQFTSNGIIEGINGYVDLNIGINI